MTYCGFPVSFSYNDLEDYMHCFDDKTQVTVVRIFLLVHGIFLLFWWPLSHWLYPDAYHHLLGFKEGTYSDALVKIIGTCGCVPVLLLLMSALHPLRNRDSVAAIIIFAVLIGCTYVYLIQRGEFPVREYANVVLSFSSAVFLIIFYPWKYATK
jgi:hypothetical protein